MNSYRKINNITAWFAFAVAFLVYVLTVEPTASFWDCAEYIATSYKLEVPHPPGAPFFLLTGRLFSLFVGNNVEKIAHAINMISVLSSSFTILFLFWSITMLGRKILKVKEGEETNSQTLLLMGSGLIGALACIFADSFWAESLEAETYSFSLFLTAIVFWAILRWELMEDQRKANKWLILIAYLLGIALGSRFMNLLAIPAMAFIFYFKNYKATTKGVVITLIIGAFLVLFIESGIITGLPGLAFGFEIFFINSLGLPFGSGVIFLILLVLGSLVAGIVYSIKKQNVSLNTALLSLAFILLGYTSYTITAIRANYDPPVNENSPQDVMRMLSYLKREQYGDRPLLYGQYFTADVIDQKKSPIYVKGEEKYEVAGNRIRYTYDPKKSTILPRIYSSNDPRHVQRYKELLGLKGNEEPNFFDNIHFMISHQMGHMYMRYFLWNFAGRESDIQDAAWLAPWDGFKKLPEVMASNKARNNFFMLPLILGIIGMIFQYKNDPKRFWVVFLLFAMLGLVLNFYLNSPPIEPRERDYIYIGSIYAFTIWIGLGVMGLAYFLNRFTKSRNTAAVIAVLLSLIAPGLMAYQGWDNHDRTDRYFSVDSAKNFLGSLAPNAILFTGGDNDTFPLWYAQEVEGFRTDVRVIVLSYFNTDWYINQMRRQTYESKPLPFTYSPGDYKQGTNDYLPFVENPNVKGAINLDQYLNLIQEKHPALQVPVEDGMIGTVPAKDFFMDVDTTAVLKSGIIPEKIKPQLQEKMVINLKGRGLEKKDLMFLDFLRTNNWERPIYFNFTSLRSIGLNLDNNVVQEGNVYRLLPVLNPSPGKDFVSTDIMYDNMMNKSYWRQLNNPKVYYDQNYRNFVSSARVNFNTLADALLQEGRDQEAKKALLKSLEVMPDISIPYDQSSPETVRLMFAVGEKERALEMANVMGDRADEFLTYAFENDLPDYYDRERSISLMILNQLGQYLKAPGYNDLATKYQEAF
ncbi:protein O-mannosyl-transferase family, partial [Xanthovirga aplysinae]|uniref:protein O-mannosyl-transferase family n=1 Tax=Xanthovirga aplysinae TaxID=2529853 RepID=UPI0012BC02BA